MAGTDSGDQSGRDVTGNDGWRTAPANGAVRWQPASAGVGAATEKLDCRDAAGGPGALASAVHESRTAADNPAQQSG